MFPVLSCPGPLEPALQAVGMWEGPSRALLAELGGDFGGQGWGWFVDGVRCESQSFPPVVPSEVPVCEQAEGRAF